ncbi:MAG: protease [Methanomethylophilus alvi]|nr:MAG: protease [Methanomethylophilus alvi]
MKAAYRLRTLSIFVILTLFMMLIGFVIGWFFGYGLYGLVLMLAVSVLISFFSYWFSKQSALRANRVHLVTREEEPRLYGIVEKVAKEAGLPMPEVGVCEAPMPNAFATGRNPKNAAVVATRGILRALNDDELEAVIGHEMSHVKNRDILVMSVASCMVAILTYAARMLFYGAVFSGGDRDNRNSALMLVVAAVCVIFVPIAGLILQLAVSRNREYLADETGARITHKPRELASALMKLERGCSSPNNDYSDTAHANMWISEPCRKGFARNLFSTHPSTQDRVEKLEKLAAAMDGGRVREYTPGEDSSKSVMKTMTSR